jgi:hypothetical protein
LQNFILRALAIFLYCSHLKNKAPFFVSLPLKLSFMNSKIFDRDFCLPFILSELTSHLIFFQYCNLDRKPSSEVEMNPISQYFSKQCCPKFEASIRTSSSGLDYFQNRIALRLLILCLSSTHSPSVLNAIGTILMQQIHTTLLALLAPIHFWLIVIFLIRSNTYFYTVNIWGRAACKTNTVHPLVLAAIAQSKRPCSCNELGNTKPSQDRKG